MFAFLMGLKTISPETVHRAIQVRAVTIVDVNSFQSWTRAHLPGALHLDPANFRQDQLPADANANIVFYCSNPMCRKAPSAARRARKMGYANVQVMSAGITGWLAAQLPTEGQTNT